MKTTVCSILMCMGMIADSLQADFIQVPIGDLVNQDLRTYLNGGNYPVAPTILTVGGIDFDLVPLGATPNSLGILGPNSNTTTSIAVDNFYGATTVYSLINSGFGTNGVTNGQVQFFGTNGAFASYDLTQGFNIRDHLNGNYNNLVTDPTIVTANFGGGVRLDRQTYMLPIDFADELLTEIRLVTYDNTGIQGYPFVAAFTAQSSVPEPSSFLMIAVAACGLTNLGCRRKSRSGCK